MKIKEFFKKHKKELAIGSAVVGGIGLYLKIRNAKYEDEAYWFEEGMRSAFDQSFGAVVYNKNRDDDISHEFNNFVDGLNSVGPAYTDAKIDVCPDGSYSTTFYNVNPNIDSMRECGMEAPRK